MSNKLFYYLGGYIDKFKPVFIIDYERTKFLKSLSDFDKEYIYKRVDYYCKLNEIKVLPQDVEELSQLKLGKKRKTYFFDTYEYTKFFPKNLKMAFQFGDITEIPEIPSILKSRPILGKNENSVLMKLNKVRHFIFLEDKIPFHEKKNMLVGRMDGHQERRKKFLKMYINHPMFDVGNTNPVKTSADLVKEKISKKEHLQYKFVSCIEGVDVASNLKWVMSSNSLAVSPKLKFETWFMEGQLIPDFHFVEMKDDYSDAEEKMHFFIENPGAANEIILNANKFVEQFKNSKRENLISLLVLKKYFEKTGQGELLDF